MFFIQTTTDYGFEILQKKVNINQQYIGKRKITQLLTFVILIPIDRLILRPLANIARLRREQINIKYKKVHPVKGLVLIYQLHKMQNLNDVTETVISY